MGFLIERRFYPTELAAGTSALLARHVSVAVFRPVGTYRSPPVTPLQTFFSAFNASALPHRLFCECWPMKDARVNRRARSLLSGSLLIDRDLVFEPITIAVVDSTL